GCRAGLRAALDAGAAVLRAGGSAVDASVAAVVVLEDDPLFNAGRGAVLAADGSVELDAAVMDGSDRRAGAIAGAKTPRNPILLARAVMDHTPHVLLAGAGADALAIERSLPIEPPSYFRTDERAAQLARAQGFTLDAAGTDVYGTVGAVARDEAGHVAAATSTGGMTNKRPGRVGDSPILGAGTFAWDRTCAISGTGHGEPFVRLGVAARVSAWIELGGLTLAAAADRVIRDELPGLGGRGGLIAVDASGAIAMPFVTGGMFRGVIADDRAPETAIW
ncbi:MAG: isoaspartyl peptidase/L-asparaginase, partial [Myxococcota bacterium]